MLALAAAAPHPAANAQTVTLTVAPDSIDEDAGPTTVTVTAQLSASRSGVTDVTLSLAGTATEGTDYRVSGSLPTIRIPSNITSASASLTVTPVNDTLWGGDTDETIEFNGTATGGLNVTGDEIGIVDNESRPGITMEQLVPSSVSENAGRLSITIGARVTGQATFHDDTVITLSRSGSATQSSDYTLEGAVLTMTIPGGGTTATAMVNLTIVDDSIAEGWHVNPLRGTRPAHMGCVRPIADDPQPRLDMVGPGSMDTPDARTN